MHLAVGAVHSFCGVENNELKSNCVLNVILETLEWTGTSARFD